MPQTITIDKDVLYKIVRRAIREELKEQQIREISDIEQAELEDLLGKNPDTEYRKENCIEL